MLWQKIKREHIDLDIDIKIYDTQPSQEQANLGELTGSVPHLRQTTKRHDEKVCTRMRTNIKQLIVIKVSIQ